MPSPSVIVAGSVAGGSTIAAAADHHTSLTSVILASAALVGAVTALWRFLHLGELIAGTRAFLQDWNGEPARPGVEARPGFPARMATVERRVEGVAHDFRGEVTSRLILLGEGVDNLQTRGEQNHDSLNRLEGRVDAVDRRITDHRRRNEEQIESLRVEVERRLTENNKATGAAFTRAETFRAALHELGIDAHPPELPHPEP